MFSLLKKLAGNHFTPLNLIQISKQNLIFNYNYLSSLNPSSKVAPVLKSNAYGHGIVLIGKALDSVKAPFYCVDSLYEAFQLSSKAKVKTPILIMGYIHPNSLKVKTLPFSFAVYDLDHAKALSLSQHKAKIHLFIDTGMNREGVSLEELPEFLKAIKQFNNLTVEGVMTHLAESMQPNSSLTKLQVKNFNKAKEIILASGFNPKWFHIGGSYGLLNHLSTGCNLVRVGRAVFGIAHDPKLKPVLKFTSTLVQIKKVKKGEVIGYDSTFKAPKDMTIGLLPLGYNDGLDRRLSNKGSVLVNNTKCPITGLVSMNVTTIDISSVKAPFLGQEAVVFSDKPDDINSVENSSKTAGTISHELLIHLSESTKRELI